MKPSFCYWSVVFGPHTPMMAAAIYSARKAGVREDFHIWSDHPLAGAGFHPLGAFDRRHFLFKFAFLQKAVETLPYDYFVWLDGDTVFVRNPADLLGLMQGSPVHASLESDVCRPENRRPDWWGCPLPMFAALMRSQGVRSREIYNVNAGFWIVHRDVAETFRSLAMEFWQHCRNRGFTFTEEAPLAYATHLLCGDPHRHLLRTASSVWASDWTGHFLNRLPDGNPWNFEDYLTGEQFAVNPAIVHAMRSKALLRAEGIRRGFAIATDPATIPA